MGEDNKEPWNIHIDRWGVYFATDKEKFGFTFAIDFGLFWFGFGWRAGRKQ